MADTVEIEVTDQEVEWLLDDLIDRYGYDFTDYSRASFKRRVTRLMSQDKFLSFAEFRYRLGEDATYLTRFVEQVTVNVTEMFRDPHFYKVLREQILPVLATWPMIRIWHAGCSTGEEVYSVAILLKEANLLHKSVQYATDINPSVLERARAGIFPLSQMKQYSENYILSGGRLDFSSYYTAQYNSVKFDDSLGRRVVLATHNLVSDGTFNEFQLILCRNVMIYFDKILQDKVTRLFYDSLETLGYLALGSKETIKFTTVFDKFQQLENRERIWRRVK
ncbi:MAG TPA: protein-glutamate O-methyltransferase CheR [Chryseolinea sp.]|nr:protein-glutamate O-methyltransferase CheR [Chryseolinea sp.]